MKGARGHVASASAWTMAGFVALSLAGIVGNALIARALDPAALGAYFLTFSVVASAAAVGRAGLNQAVIPLVARVRSGAGARGEANMLRTVLKVAAAAALGVSSALGLLLPLLARAFDSPALTPLAWLAAAWCFAEALRLVASEALRAVGDVRLATVLGDAGRHVLFVVAVAGAMLLPGRTTVVTVLSAAMAAATVVLVLSLVALRPHLARRQDAAGTVPATAVLGVSAPMATVALAVVAVSHGDVWLAGRFLSDVDVATYAASARLVILVLFPLFITNVVISPLIARYHVEGRYLEMERMLRLAASTTLIASLPIAAALLLRGDLVLQLVYGEFYRSGAVVLGILTCGQLVNAAAGSCGQALLMTGHQSTMMLVSLVSAAVFLLGGAAATYTYGATGLAVAAATTAAASNLALLLLVRRRLGLWTFATARLRRQR